MFRFRRHETIIVHIRLYASTSIAASASIPIRSLFTGKGTRTTEPMPITAGTSALWWKEGLQTAFTDSQCSFVL